MFRVKLTTMKRDTPRKKRSREAAKAVEVGPDPAARTTVSALPVSAVVDRSPAAARPAADDLVDSATPVSVAQPTPAVGESIVATTPLDPTAAAVPVIEPSPVPAAELRLERHVDPVVEPAMEPVAESAVRPAAERTASPSSTVEGQSDAHGEVGPPPSEIGRRGQIQAAKARFDLGPQQRILGEALGKLPPGYGLTHCSAWVRDPRHVIAVWDINSAEQTERGQELGWERVVLRLLDPHGNVLRQIPVARRSGIWHVLVPNPGMAVRIAIGFAHGDGRFETVARSHYVQLPPGEPGPHSTEETARLPSQLDRRTLLRAEPPPRPGFRADGRESPGWRLHQRIRISRRAAQAESWFGPFRTNWDSGVAPPPRVVIEPEPEPSSDDDSNAASSAKPRSDKSGATGSSPEAISESTRRESSAPTTEAAAPAFAGATQAGVEPRLTGRQPDTASETPINRPYENLPSPACRTLRQADSGANSDDGSSDQSPSAHKPGAPLESAFELSTEPMSSPRGGFGKPRPERA